MARGKVGPASAGRADDAIGCSSDEPRGLDWLEREARDWLDSDEDYASIGVWQLMSEVSYAINKAQVDEERCVDALEDAKEEVLRVKADLWDCFKPPTDRNGEKIVPGARVAYSALRDGKPMLVKSVEFERGGEAYVNLVDPRNPRSLCCVAEPRELVVENRGTT